MMLAADLTTYYNRVRRHLDCPKDEQNRLLLGVNKQVIELQQMLLIWTMTESLNSWENQRV